jgi:hypothetical protein
MVNMKEMLLLPVMLTRTSSVFLICFFCRKHQDNRSRNQFLQLTRHNVCGRPHFLFTRMTDRVCVR